MLLFMQKLSNFFTNSLWFIESKAFEKSLKNASTWPNFERELNINSVNEAKFVSVDGLGKKPCCLIETSGSL